MARTSIAGNLRKMIHVQAGVAEGLSVSKACKAAGTSSGTYKKWLARYKALLMPRAVAPLERGGAYSLTPDGRFAFVVNDGEAGVSLCRISLEDGTQVSALLEAPRGRYDYRSVLAAQAAADGQSVVFMLSWGTLHRWTPGGGIEQLAVDLTTEKSNFSGMSMSGVRQWTCASFTPDGSCIAYWRTLSHEKALLRMIRLSDGEETYRYTLTGNSIQPPIVFHPSRPLIALFGRNKLIRVLNHETNEVVVESGPQIHSVSFGPGDTLLCDDWYGKTVVYNYVENTKTPLSPGWGSHASQSTRFFTAKSDVLTLRDMFDTGFQHILPIEEIKSCCLSVDGSALAIKTEEHVSFWRVADLLSEAEPA